MLNDSSSVMSKSLRDKCVPALSSIANCFNSFACPNRLGTPLTNFHLFVAGEAEADEPFAVDFLGQLFQQRDAPFVVFNQLIIRRENRGDLSAESARSESRTWKFLSDL